MEILVAVAVVPAALLLIHVYRKDRLEKEPAGLLWKLLFLGALSGLPAVLLEEGGSYLIQDFEGTLLYSALENFLVVALAEEGCKYFMLRKATWKHPAFDCSFDGLLYSVFVSLGFAILENILYVLTEGLEIGIYRAFTSIPCHCFDGVFMGVLYAKAKQEDYLGNRRGARRYCRRALWTAVLAHGAYDFLLDQDSTAAILTFLGLLIVLYIVGFKMINRASAEDHFISPGPRYW